MYTACPGGLRGRARSLRWVLWIGEQMRGSYLSRSGKLSALVASTVGLGLCSSAANAATILWAAAVEADWHVAANWNPAQVPVAGDVAQVNNGGTTVYSAAS